MTGRNVSEGAEAERLLAGVRGRGYRLADGACEASRLDDAAAASGYQLVAPRGEPAYPMRGAIP